MFAWYLQLRWNRFFACFNIGLDSSLFAWYLPLRWNRFFACFNIGLVPGIFQYLDLKGALSCSIVVEGNQRVAKIILIKRCAILSYFQICSSGQIGRRIGCFELIFYIWSHCIQLKKIDLYHFSRPRFCERWFYFLKHCIVSNMHYVIFLSKGDFWYHGFWFRKRLFLGIFCVGRLWTKMEVVIHR